MGASERPVSRRIADALVQTGRLAAPGRPTVTVPTVAAEFGVSTTVAAAALRTGITGGLRDLGLLEHE